MPTPPTPEPLTVARLRAFLTTLPPEMDAVVVRAVYPGASWDVESQWNATTVEATTRLTESARTVTVEIRP